MRTHAASLGGLEQLMQLGGRAGGAGAGAAGGELLLPITKVCAGWRVEGAGWRVEGAGGWHTAAHTHGVCGVEGGRYRLQGVGCRR